MQDTPRIYSASFSSLKKKKCALFYNEIGVQIKNNRLKLGDLISGVGSVPNI